MSQEHIVKSFDRDLKALKEKILEMGGATMRQLTDAMSALDKKDGAAAAEILKKDAAINALQVEVDRMTVNLLAMRQPVALDLRYVVSGLKIAADLERIADYAGNMVKYIDDVSSLDQDEAISMIRRMVDAAEEMLAEVMDAYRNEDAEKAEKVWRMDDRIDSVYSSLIGGLRKFMSDNPDSVQACTQLIFTGRCCERIGDHITNMAESVYYIVTGDSFH